MNDIPKFQLPQIVIITNESFDDVEEGLKDNRYLTIMRNVTKEKLLGYLLEKESY